MKRLKVLSVIIAGFLVFSCSNFFDFSDAQKPFNVTFDSNGGSGTMTQQEFFRDETQALINNRYSRTGYEFAGWAKKANAAKAEYADGQEVSFGNAVTLYAKWNANTYKVKFDKNANDATGEAPAEIQATYDKDFALPENTFTKIGYNFAGWNTKADGSGTDYEANANAKNLTTENGATVTLYAKWTERGTHNITYELNGGNHIGIPTTSFKETEDVTLGTAERTGYTFSGWYEAEDFSGTAVTSWNVGEKTEDVTLYAKWNANTYKVKFDKNANDATGEAPAEIQATYDKDFALPENTFTKIGYNFAGWNTKADGSGTDYEANATVKNLTAENGATVILYAKWTERGTHNITYELNGGSHIGIPTTSFKETEDVTLGTAERTGYTFGGWYEAEDFSGTAVTSWKSGEKTEDVTLYAKWTAIEYTITYENLENATNDNSESYTIEDSITLKNPTKDGFTFLGWYETEDFSGNTVTGWKVGEKTKDLTLYAKWTAIVYSITYELDGGTNVDGNPANYTIETETITLKEPTKDGYTFVCWYSDRSKKTEIAKGSTGDIVLQAVWKNDTDFVKVPAVSINGSENWMPDSKVFVSGRKLEIKAFWMSDHQVTRGEYKEIMGSAPSTAKAYDKNGNELTGNAADNNPVNYVSWYNAIVYCNKRSIKESLTPCYTINGSTAPDNWGDVPTKSNDTWNAATCDWNANGYRLPTEAEWEWAARGGENYKYAGSDDIAEVAWYTENTNDTGTREVKTKKANGYELYDMSGNVWEWCWDWYGKISSSTPATGASSGSYRCLRGGSCYYYDYGCEVAGRGSGYGGGLRLVRSAQ